MLLWRTFQSLSAYLILAASVVRAQDPAEVYGSAGNIDLRIGNGGAGQSGLIKALANGFIGSQVKSGKRPFKVAWYRSDTTVTIKYLNAGIVDVGITYSEVAEKIAIKQGIATDPSYYAFRDHFLLVGPPSNPAKLDNKTDVLTQFSKLYEEAERGNSTPPVRFLSRFDKSATNMKEEFLFLSIGQVPWATAYSTWYHQYIAFPIQALTAAILLDEYTLTDRGTFLSLPKNMTDKTVIYKRASDDASDPLLNPAHLLIGTQAKKPDVAKAFAKWLVGKEGQSIVKDFKKNGEQLYTPAP